MDQSTLEGLIAEGTAEAHEVAMDYCESHGLIFPFETHNPHATWTGSRSLAGAYLLGSRNSRLHWRGSGSLGWARSRTRFAPYSISSNRYG